MLPIVLGIFKKFTVVASHSRIEQKHSFNFCLSKLIDSYIYLERDYLYQEKGNSNFSVDISPYLMPPHPSCVESKMSFIVLIRLLEYIREAMSTKRNQIVKNKNLNIKIYISTKRIM